MAEARKSRKKAGERERINLDEWGNAGALEGLLSFLEIAPAEAPVNQGAGASRVLRLIEERGQGQAGIPDRDSVPVTGTVSDTGTGSATDTLPVIGTGPAWSHPKQAVGFGNKKIYRCVASRDGHSHSEEALYQILWRAGKPEDADRRITVMGYGEMSKLVRLSFNNTKYACRRLIQKLAIEEIAREISDRRQGKTYRVYSDAAIVERRRARGMEWVIRSKGVEFVWPMGTPPVSDRVSVLDPDSKTDPDPFQAPE